MDDRVLRVLGFDDAVDPLQESEKFLVSVTPVTTTDYLAGFDVQSGEQGRRPMSSVVMRSSFRRCRPEWQQWLGTIQCLDLRLLINTQNDRTVRWIHVQANDVANLLHE